MARALHAHRAPRDAEVTVLQPLTVAELLEDLPLFRDEPYILALPDGRAGS
mgnify:CR=1 FL=1